MNTFLIVLFIVIVFIILCAFMYMYFYNRINDTIIRINEAENRIDNNLRDKYDILNKCITIVKGKIELDDKTFQQIAKLKTKKISNFDLDRTLVNTYNEFVPIYENNKELRESDELYKSVKQLELIDEELATLRNYYNGNITLYNKIIKTFPALIIAKMKNYEEKLFYDLKDMNDEDMEDFKL